MPAPKPTFIKPETTAMDEIIRRLPPEQRKKFIKWLKRWRKFDKKFLIRDPGGISKVLKAAKVTIYLANYVMEAVGFSEFIYQEAIQTGLQPLRILREKKRFKDLNYMAEKFENEVYFRGMNFHFTYGPLNPFTFPGFSSFYRNTWQKYRQIIKR